MIYTILKSEQMFGFSQKVGTGWLAVLEIYAIMRERTAKKEIVFWGLGQREKDKPSGNERRKSDKPSGNERKE